MSILRNNLLVYRELLYSLLIKGFKSKYKNSFLGIFWSLLNPLINVMIFAFIFTFVIKIDIKNYPLYLLCVIFPWNFFNSGLINAVVSIVEESHFVKNVRFAFVVIPIAVVLVNLVNFLIDLLILAPALIFLGKGVNIFWLYLPVLIAGEFVLVSALAIFASGAYVIFRDTNFILNLFLRLFFYFVPVIYSLDLVPAGFRGIYLLNPLAVFIDGFARVLFYGVCPDLKMLILAFSESLLVLAIACYFFQKIRPRIPERL